MDLHHAQFFVMLSSPENMHNYGRIETVNRN